MDVDVHEPWDDIAALEVQDAALRRLPFADFDYSPVLDDDGASTNLFAGGEDVSFDDDSIRYPQLPPSP